MSSSSGETSSVGFISFREALLNVHVPDQPNAQVSAAGELRIAGKTVELTRAQRQLMQRYYASAWAARQPNGDDPSGAATVRALGRVVSGQVDNLPLKLRRTKGQHPKRATAGDQLALPCADLSGGSADRQALARRVPAFARYAGVAITPAGSGHCRSSIHTSELP